MPQGYKFVIADDHPLFRGALKQAIGGMADDGVVLEAGDFEAAKKIVAENEDLDLVLLDLSMPGASGLSGLISLRGVHAEVPMVVVSAHDAEDVARHRARDALSFPIVADPDRVAARRFGVRVPSVACAEAAARTAQAEPITVLPATFVIGTDRRIAFAFVDPDPRQRAEPARVAQVLAALVTPA